MKNNELYENKLLQLKRALELSIDFESSYYIVFSDYPSVSHMKLVLSSIIDLTNCELILDRIHLYK